MDAASPTLGPAAATSGEKAKAASALGKNAERLRIALVNSPTTLFEQDLDLRYTWIFSPKLGYAAEEVLGRTDADLMDAAHASRLEAIKRQVIASGTAARERVATSRPDGPLEWYDLYVEPSRDDAGRIVGVICSATDITAALAAEAELKASERRKALLLELGDALRSAGDPDGVLAAAAERLCAEIGGDRVVYAEVYARKPVVVAAAEWSGGAVSRAPDPSWREHGPEFLALLGLGKPVVVDDVSTDPRTGSPEARRSFAARSIGAFLGAPLIEGGALTALFTVYSNVPRAWSAFDVETLRAVAERAHASIERSRAETETRSNRALLAALFDQAPVAIGLIDTQGQYVLRNSQLGRYVAEAMPSRDDRNVHRWTLFDSSGREVGRDDFPGAQALRGAPTAMEGKFLEFDGRQTWVHVAATPLKDTKGAVTGAITVITDINASKEAQEALRESETRLRLALQGANAAAWQREIATGRIRFSPEAAAIYERPDYGPHDFAEWQERVHPDDRARTLAELKEVQESRRADQRVEYRLLFPGGRIKWVRSLGKVAFDANGAPARISGILMDITDEKLAEAALRESEERLHIALQVARAVAFVRDFRSGTLRYEPDDSALFEQPAGTPADDETLLRIIHPEDRGQLVALRRELVEGKRTHWRWDFRLLFPDGRIKWVLTVGEAMFDSNGEPYGVRGIHMDVTHEKVAEAALRDSEERLRIALQGARAVAFERDFRSGKFHYEPEDDPIFERPHDRAPNEDTLLQLLHPEDRDDFLAVQRELMDGKRTHWRSEYRLLLPDGRVKWVLSAGRTMVDANGKPYGARGVRIDVTPEKLAQEALRRSEEELKALNEELAEWVEREVQARQAAQMKLAHAEKMAALGQLAGGIAHDFNNVLQTVLISAAYVQRRPDDPAQTKAIAARIEEAATRGAAITGRLLAFARRDGLSREAVDVGAVMTELTAMLKSAQAPGVHYVVETAPGLPKAATDRHQLETALVNLATNAADAIAGDGKITFSVREERALDGGPQGLAPGSYLRIDVQDDGVGMDEAILSHLFEPFFTTKELGRGTGLGLATARSFAQRSGGAIAIASRPGEGTTASLWLPVAAGKEASASPAGSPSPGAGRPLRVLLVDDDRPLRETLALELGDHGLAVDVAEGGPEALARIDAGAVYDVIVSDLAMPRMTGAALLDEARRRVPDIPAIILTGNTCALDAQALERTGGRLSLIRKPISGPALAAAIADLVRT